MTRENYQAAWQSYRSYRYWKSFEEELQGVKVKNARKNARHHIAFNRKMFRFLTNGHSWIEWHFERAYNQRPQQQRVTGGAR